MGSVELCKEMITSALRSGADCVKLQSGFVEECFDEKLNHIKYLKIHN